MNIFIIPSWYPSTSNPSYGIFIKEQAEMMGALRQTWNIGISTWGQGDERKMLWSKDHIRNLGKLSKHRGDQHSSQRSGNLITYYQPALSWTKRFRKGNLREIVRCNELNFQSYLADHGHCDLIEVQASYPGAMVGAYLAQKYSLPYHVHIRLGGFMFEHLLRDLGGLKHDFLNAIRGASLISTTSEFQEVSLQTYFEGLKVIHNPVDTTFFIPQLNQTNGLLAVGRLEHEKGFDMLIHAISKEDHLTIIGEGSQHNKLKSLAGELGKNDHVIFEGHGNRQKVREKLRSCDFLIMPSRYETFGNVLLETMACGKPVLATACGGPQEIVSEQTGVICEPSVDGIRTGIELIKERRNEFSSEVIRKEVETRFGANSWVERLEKLFKSIV